MVPSLNNRSMLLLSLKLAVTIGLCLGVAVAELQRLQHPAGDDESLRVLVVGDWGRKGTHNQSEVAVQMGKTAEEFNPDFIISTGDNFYEDGLTGTDDAAFDESFSNIYTAPSLQKQWYSVLGNHDYRGDALAQLSPILTQRDNKWLCLKSYILDAEIVEFFFVDTTPFEDKYFNDPGDDTYDWRGVVPREKYLSSLLKDVDSALRESSAKWKIVVGHHTIKSAGQHGNTVELVAKLLPILQASDVDLYINGHDHCLQHISDSDSPLQFLTSGGGSKAWRGDVSWWNPAEMKFYYDGQGFMTLEVTQTEVGFVFYDIVGNVLHKWSITKPTHPTAATL
ncbi:purple acid phosphatase 8-like [Rhododendron vialii]|uniref:purple acid phosphatase 8-like n=1 Tax=Rhododendron vialii TaxID=182163 RepID=UPI00265DEF7D|nr:purple acid phosphatase 8-like [Rhododendron vialii]